METLIWMGVLGVAGIMALIWTAHKLYQKVMGWRRKDLQVQGRDINPGLSISEGVNSRGQHIFAGVAAGVLTYMILSLIVNLLSGDSIGITFRQVAMVVEVAVAVAVGVRVYRLLRRRAVKRELENQ